MHSLALFNIALEIFAFFVSLIMLSSLLVGNAAHARLNHLFAMVLSGNCVILICDIISWALEGRTGSHITSIVWFTNFCVITLCLPVAALYTGYLVTYLRTKTSLPRNILPVMYSLYVFFFMATIAAEVSGQCFYIDASNRYCRGSLFWVPFVMPATSLVLQVVLILYSRKKLKARNTIALLSYIILQIVAVVIQFTAYGLLNAYVASAAAWLIVFFEVQMGLNQQLTEKELELANIRIDMMLSQIQPHFLYNTLNTIENLCLKDGKQAAEMVRNFAGYLRENMDALTQKELVPFEKELLHIQTYLSLEQKRFGQRLNIQYQLDVTDFLLPTLTVQPLVENAVTHGVVAKPEGGTVTLATRRTAAGVQIIVTDDGIGYNPSENAPKSGRIGLQNVTTRLQAQCGGSIQIEGSLGSGTTVTMTIPERSKQ